MTRRPRGPRRILGRRRDAEGRVDERGQGLVELSIVLPVILLLLVSMFEFGMAFNDLLTIGYGSREGARVGSALANGGAIGCSPSDPAAVDATAVAAVQRILKSPGSDVVLSDIEEIRLFKATSTGAQAGSAVNVWVYSPGGGPDVDPGPGATRIDFREASHGWDVCSRINSGPNPDSIGVQVVYRYRLTTPLAAVLSLIGGSQAATITLREQTVMALNPSA